MLVLKHHKNTIQNWFYLPYLNKDHLQFIHQKSLTIHIKNIDTSSEKTQKDVSMFFMIIFHVMRFFKELQKS